MGAVAFGPLPPRLFPSLGTLARTCVGLITSGILLDTQGTILLKTAEALRLTIPPSVLLLAAALRHQ